MTHLEKSIHKLKAQIHEKERIIDESFILNKEPYEEKAK